MSQFETAQRHLSRALRRLETALERRLSRPPGGGDGIDPRALADIDAERDELARNLDVLRDECDRLSAALSRSAAATTARCARSAVTWPSVSTARSSSSTACSGASAMPTVEIMVNGRRHLMQCGEGEEARVRQLASYVDRRVTDLARGQAQAGDARLLLMASLMVADELSDAFDEIKRLQGGARGARRRRRAARRPRRSSRSRSSSMLLPPSWRAPN